MSDIDVKFLALAWTVLTFLFSAGIAYGTMRLTLRYHGQELSDIKEDVKKNGEEAKTRIDNHEHFVRGVLFRPDGVPNYLPRQECESCRMACQSRIDARLVAMQNTIEGAERKRDAAVERWTGAFEKIAQQIGRLEGKLGNGNGGK